MEKSRIGFRKELFDPFRVQPHAIGGSLQHERQQISIFHRKVNTVVFLFDGEEERLAVQGPLRVAVFTGKKAYLYRSCIISTHWKSGKFIWCLPRPSYHLGADLAHAHHPCQDARPQLCFAADNHDERQPVGGCDSRRA